MDKKAQQSYYVANKKTSPGERFVSGVQSAGVPSAALTGILSGLSGAGLKRSLQGAGVAGLAGLGAGYFLAPKERKVLIPKDFYDKRSREFTNQLKNKKQMSKKAEQVFEKIAISQNMLSRAFVKRRQNLKGLHGYDLDVYDKEWDRTLNQINRMKDDIPRNDPRYQTLGKLRKHMFNLNQYFYR